MLSRDPADRPGFDHLLSSFQVSIFPEYFYTFLKDYVSSLADLPNTSAEINFLQRVASSPGTRIDRVLAEWESISVHLDSSISSAQAVDPGK
jgi:phosphoinositide-3-kinase regulatory subunit 4